MSKSKPSTPDLQHNWTPGGDPKTEREADAFFQSPEIEKLKALICDLGRRLWQKDFVDGNGGNLTIRVGDNLVLCTPTMISKGFMQPEDMCLVDMDGQQLAGTRKRTSEVLTHIGIMKRQPNAKACCHAHPPVATGFAVAGVAPGRFLTPESESFVGEVGIAEFRMPGSPECSEVVGRLGVDHTTVFMGNHGVITRGRSVEMAYWRIEVVESLCRNYLVARDVKAGDKIPQITGEYAKRIEGGHRWLSENA